MTKKIMKRERKGRVPVLVGDFSLLPVGLDEHSRITDKVRVPFGQDELHSLRVHEGHKPKHPLLLVWDPHILNRPINAKQNA